MGKGKRHQATAAEVHEAYMPHVPFKFYRKGRSAPGFIRGGVAAPARSGRHKAKAFFLC